MDVAALVVAIAVGITTVWYTRRSARSAAGAEISADRSAKAAELTAGLDLQRRHAELQPRFRVAWRRWAPGSEDLKLTVKLLGPPELERLDGLTVSIRDDNPWRAEATPLPGGPTREEIAAKVWSGYQFKPGVGPGADPVRGIPGADPTGRTTPTLGMPVGEELPFPLVPTRRGWWMEGMTPEMWRREMGTVVKLRFECEREGWEPWIVVGEIDTAAGSGSADL